MSTAMVWEDQSVAADLDATPGSESAMQQIRDFATSAIASGSPLSWYETLYASAAAGAASAPWDHREPMPALVEWLHGRYRDGRNGSGRAVVVGCGYGHDAEFVASLGFITTAFDISAMAVQTAHERHEFTPSTTDRRNCWRYRSPGCMASTWWWSQRRCSAFHATCTAKLLLP